MVPKGIILNFLCILLYPLFKDDAPNVLTAQIAYLHPSICISPHVLMRNISHTCGESLAHV
jgi:hypothetical protein